MSDETLLSDLCAICHVKAIKYTCPRCGIHTCSLPCVQKHKTRAQCSGVRNPAEYRKRADLATASSIDKDFNFITNVERSMTKADEDALDRGIFIAPARRSKPTDARPKVEIEIEQRGVKVIRAPKGLSRAKLNKTHWVGPQKSIMWTIEWFCPDGEKITGAALEKRTVGEAYIFIVGKKKAQRKRRLSQLEQAHTQARPSKAAKRERTDGAEALTENKQEDITSGQQPPATPSSQRERSNNLLEQQEAIMSDLHFYLHDPTTSSRFKCLIPLSSDQSLSSILEGKTILEYPTLYALYESPDQLREPFLSQDDYRQRHGADIPINITAQLADGEVEDNHEAAIDPQKVIEMLAQDLAG